MPVKQRILSVLFWSVIAAAFIGPGTLVTASTAGSKYGLELLWALAFATVACIVFQEMAARLTLVTGKDLAATLGQYRLRWLISIIPLSVILGCVAYEAGNIQGAAVGMNMLFPEWKNYSFVAIGIFAITLLSLSSFKGLILVLGELVAFMGIAFLVISIRIAPPVSEFFSSLFVPSIPAGSDWIVLGLIGTTVVPYNLFLGSGISKDSTVGMMRFGLITSVVLGGLISMAVLVTGTLMNGAEGLQDLVSVARSEHGYISGTLMALGLFAAGFTSAITAPLAAGIISKGFFRNEDKVIRIIGVTVVILGMLSGLLDFSPEVIILAAQALNGLVLPLVAALLWVLSNTPSLMKDHLSPLAVNILAYLIMNVLIVLGLRNIMSGLSGMINADAELSMPVLWMVAVPISTILAFITWRVRAAGR